MSLRTAFTIAIALLVYHTTPAAAATAYGCNGTLTDALRDEVLTLFNTLRKEATDGQTIVDNAQKALDAENMYKLDWSCEFEQMAQDLVQNCNAAPTTPPPNNALNFEDAFAGQNPPITDPLKKAFALWKAQITANAWPANNVYLAAIKQFQEMVRAATVMVGCSEATCGGGKIASAACIFDLPPLVANDVVFTSGKACTAGGPCSTYAPSECDKTSGLCIKSPTSTASSTTESSTVSSASSSGSTASTVAGGTTNAHPNPSVNQICPGNANMNDRIREKALMMHNYRRSLLANGQVAKNNGNYLPAGANMIQLKYDCNLEKTAKAHADTCSFGYSSAASTVSENIARIPKTATVVNRINATSEAVKSWWKNVRTQSVNIGMQVTFKQKHVGQPIEAFIKMAWANTRNIGCGGKLCGNDFFIVCQYTPKGAIAGQVVYQKGNPCSACPAATYCSSPLCVVP